MTSDSEILNRHRAGIKNIAVGVVIILLLLLFTHGGGWGLLNYVAILLSIFAAGILLIIRGLFLRFQSGNSKKLPNSISNLLIIILVGIIFAVVFLLDRG